MDTPLLPYLNIEVNGNRLTVLLDITSQVSCVTAEAVKKLNDFTILGQTINEIHTLTGKSIQTRNVVQFPLELPSKTLKLKALQVPKIANLSKHMVYDSLPKSLRSKHVHKFNPASQSVDILIGLPQALHFIRSVDSVPDYPNLFSLKTPFGKIYAGDLLKNGESPENRQNDSGIGLVGMMSNLDKITQILEKSCEIAAMPFDEEKRISADDLACEQFFKANCTYNKRIRRFWRKNFWLIFG